MGNVTTFREPAHRRRHRVAANYLAQQNGSAWEAVKTAVLEEIGFNQFLTTVKAEAVNPSLTEAINQLEAKL